MKTYTDEDAERYLRYLQQLNGVWFASYLPKMEDWAKDHPELLKPLSTIVPNKEAADGWYVPLGWTVEDLPKYFSHSAINSFGIYRLNLDYEI